MIGYVTSGTNDLKKAAAFYDKIGLPVRAATAGFTRPISAILKATSSMRS
ncbi:hypothetical protein [Bradyrhizobium sp.]